MSAAAIVPGADEAVAGIRDGATVLIGGFGNGLVVLRLPSVIATVATVALTGMIAQRLFGDRRVALGAGLLAAVSLPLLYWGQTARGYALIGAAAWQQGRRRRRRRTTSAPVRESTPSALAGT